MNIKPGDTVYVVFSGVSDILDATVWRHATYLVAGRYWPAFRLILTPENEGIMWSSSDPAALDAFKTMLALSARA